MVLADVFVTKTHVFGGKALIGTIFYDVGQTGLPDLHYMVARCVVLDQFWPNLKIYAYLWYLQS